MDATCTIQDSIHVFSLVHKYVSRILGTYQLYDHLPVTCYNTIFRVSPVMQTGIYIIIPLTFPILQAFPPVH